MYANRTPLDWQKYFQEYDRLSVSEDGKTKVYANAMEEMYQMFKQRMKDEMTIDIWGND